MSMNREDETRKALRKDVTPGYEMRPLHEFHVKQIKPKEKWGDSTLLSPAYLEYQRRLNERYKRLMDLFGP